MGKSAGDGAAKLDAALREGAYQRRYGPHRGNPLALLESWEWSAVGLLSGFTEVTPSEYADASTAELETIVAFPVCGKWRFFRDRDERDFGLLGRLAALFHLLPTAFQLLETANDNGGLSLSDVNSLVGSMSKVGVLLTELGLVTSDTWIAGETATTTRSSNAKKVNRAKAELYAELIPQFKPEVDAIMSQGVSFHGASERVGKKLGCSGRYVRDNYPGGNPKPQNSGRKR